MNEEVTLQRADGSVSKKLFAVISRFTIIAEDPGVEIKPGDFILRTKRNGTIERYDIITVDYKIPLGKPANYQMRVKMADAVTPNTVTI